MPTIRKATLKGAIHKAALNGGTEKAGYGDMVQFNGPDGRLITGAVTNIFRAHGTVYLQLDGCYTVEAWYAKRAQVVTTIRPGSTVTLRFPIVLEHGRHIDAGVSLEVLAWREGIVIVSDADLSTFRLPIASLVQAVWPTILDPRLVVWERDQV